KKATAFGNEIAGRYYLVAELEKKAVDCQKGKGFPFGVFVGLIKGIVEDGIWSTEKEVTRLNELRAMEYADYLKTEHWQTKRKTALEAAEFRCVVCNGDEQLNVHHRT